MNGSYIWILLLGTLFFEALDVTLDIIGTKPETFPPQFYFLQLATPRHRVNRLNF